MDEAVGRCAYDRALCRAVWQRVSPNGGAFPPDTAQGSDAAASAKEASALALPGAEADPCCMGSEAALSLDVLRGFLRGELGAAQTYAYLARAVPRGEVSRAFRVLAEEAKRHARALAAADYLIGGKAYCPRVCAEQPSARDICALLRQLYHEEACAAFNYRRAGEETLDPCLARLFSSLSAEEYRHADMLMQLLGKKLAP